MTDFIRENRTCHGVESICAVLPIAPSTFYQREARRKDPALLPARAKRDAHAVNSKSCPCPSGTGRAEVWASVFEGAAYDGGGNIICSLLPGPHASPATFGHKIVKGFAHSAGVPAGSGRPGEVFGDVLAEREDHHTRPELWHAKIRSVQ